MNGRFFSGLSFWKAVIKPLITSERGKLIWKYIKQLNFSHIWGIYHFYIMASSVPNLGHELLILIMSCTYLPSFNIKFVREVSFLKTTYDVITTSSVPNLGHELLILIMSCTYLPRFNIKFVQEVSFWKKIVDISNGIYCCQVWTYLKVIICDI